MTPQRFLRGHIITWAPPGHRPKTGKVIGVLENGDAVVSVNGQNYDEIVEISDESAARIPQRTFRLENGFTILDYDSANSIVLAYLGPERHERFVTWRTQPASNDRPNELATYSGHYFAELADAMDDFEIRTGRRSE